MEIWETVFLLAELWENITGFPHYPRVDYSYESFSKPQLCKAKTQLS